MQLSAAYQRCKKGGRDDDLMEFLVALAVEGGMGGGRRGGSKRKEDLHALGNSTARPDDARRTTVDVASLVRMAADRHEKCGWVRSMGVARIRGTKIEPWPVRP